MRHSHLFWLFSFFLVSPTILIAKPAPEMPAGLQAAYQQARHQIEVIQDKDQPTRWRAVNANNHLSVDFDGKGILAHSLKDDWRLSMELTRLGERDRLKPVNPPSVQVKHNRLTYDRGTITEWYINDPKGLEQGFTLDKPLAKEQLVLQFALGGDVKPRLIDKGKILQLTTPQGKKLRYEGLKAWDAKGRDLNATLQLKDKILQLQVAVVDAVYPITIDPWLVEEQKLTADDTARNDTFGWSIAISGNTAVVGAPGDNFSTGSAYVFVFNGAIWGQQAKLVASDQQRLSFFGDSIAVSNDTVVVGAYGVDDLSGSAYVFIRNGTEWTQQKKLSSLDIEVGDRFGESVTIFGDTVMVGAIEDDDRGRASGAVYVFARSGTNWNQQDKLIASDAARGDKFGISISLSGGMLLVGAFEDDGNGAFDVGSAYIFVRSGATWIEQAKITALDMEEGDNFGASVALSGDIAVVGAPFSDDDGLSSGSAYIFGFDGVTWAQQTKLKALDASEGDLFGGSVAVFGSISVVGAFGDNDGGDAAGSAYVFIPKGTEWSQQVKLASSAPAALDFFGSAVSISGSTVMASARLDDDGGDNSGSVYTFDLSCNTTYTLPTNQWRQISLPCDPGAKNTVAAVFGDDITSDYGTTWVLYRYSGNGYVKLENPATDTLSQGVGYWIIQLSDGDITLDMPNNSMPAPVTHPTGCLAAAKGCFEIGLETKTAATQWNMIGYPFKASKSLGDVRVLSNAPPCDTGCEPGIAEPANIVHDQFWTYGESGYTLVNTSEDLKPWTGYWAATLSNADPTDPKLLIPKP